MRLQKWAKQTLKKFVISCIDGALISLVWAHSVLMVSTVQAQTFPQSRIDSPLEKSSELKFGRVFVAFGNVDKQQARLIFYKVGASHLNGGITVYFNGSYHTTLASNAFSALCTSPGVVHLAIKPVMVGGQITDDEGSSSAMEIQGGRKHYVRLTADQSIQALERVSEQAALTDLVTATEQIHTLSRVTPVQACHSPPALTEPPSAP